MRFVGSVLIAFGIFHGAASAQSPIRLTSEALITEGTYGNTYYFEHPPKDGWLRRVAYNRGKGDGNYGKRDETSIMYWFNGDEHRRLLDSQGIWTCHSRDKDKSKHQFTRGKFQFGIKPGTGRYAVVDREVVIPKGLSQDQKKAIEVAKAVAVIAAVYFENPEIPVIGEKFETLVNEVNSRNPKGSDDLTPTLIGGKERWLVWGSTSLTVRRYWDCGVSVRYKLAPPPAPSSSGKR